VGVRPSPALDELYRGLVADLRRAGYSGDWPDRLAPHITLARSVSLRTQPDLSFEPFSMTARRLSLMKSERIAGALTYTEVLGKSV
jgi:2'-5' RNA ligase